MNGHSPLNQDSCDCLTRVLGSCAETDQLIKACKECGLDVETAESQNNGQRELASRLKRTFFPMQP